MRNTLVVAVILLLLTASPAYAYIDPGMGSYVIQLLVAGFLAFGFIVKTQWRKITSFIKGKSKSAETGKNDSGE